MPSALEQQLDEVLRLRPSADVRAATAELVADVSHVDRPSHSVRDRFSRRTVAILTTVIVLSGATATAAVAAPKVIEWLNFDPDVKSTVVLDTGMVCELEYVIGPDSVTSEESDRAVSNAKEYLRTLDLRTLPLKERLAEIDSSPDDPFEGFEEGAKVGYALFGLVVADLGVHGHSDGITIEGSSDCHYGADE